MPSEDAPDRSTFEELWPHVRPVVEGAGRGDGRPVLVGVDGRSGSGKTDLAACLVSAVRELGRTCGEVHLDDLYPGWSGLAAGLEPLCAGVVTPLSRGEAGNYVSWDWHASRPGRRRDVPVEQVVVVEGVGTLAAPCADLLDLRIWLEAPARVRRERALRRDGEVFAPHWQEWADQEDALFAAGPPPADLVADTGTGRVRRG